MRRIDTIALLARHLAGSRDTLVAHGAAYGVEVR